MDLVLNADELKLVNWINEKKPTGATADKLLQVRAEVLRNLVLQLPVKIKEDADAKPLRMDETGLLLKHLEIIDNASGNGPCDKGAILHLEDACDHKGKALPPLELEYCFFHQPIHLSRARFRRLSFRGSRLIHFRANGLRVDTSINLSKITSSEEPVPYPLASLHLRHKSPGINWPRPSREMPGQKTGASIKKPRLDHAIKHIQPSEPAVDLTPVPENLDPGNAVKPEGRCWVELRSAEVGTDIDVSSAKLACAPERSDLFNSPHANYALDLRGCRIKGRLTLAPDSMKEGSPPFMAVGGVSLVRGVIGGSVNASGAWLIAVEGSAFNAQRAEIRGHLFLDYSWEKQQLWLRFHAEGFVDLTAAHIRSSIYMNGSKLLPDAHSRAGLVAAGVDVGGSCHLCGVMDFSDSPKFFPFFSAGGVALDRATIHGGLLMQGAELYPNSFGNAIYGTGLTIIGTAKLCAFETSGPNPKLIPFQATGSLALTASSYGRDLDMRGASLLQADEANRKGSLIAPLIRVQGQLLFGVAMGEDIDVNQTKELITSSASGSIFLQNARIGRSVTMTGATLHCSEKGGTALDLTCAEIQSDLKLDTRYFGDKKPVKFRFTSIGSIILQGAKVGNELSLAGASLQCTANHVVLEAKNLHVTSTANFSDVSHPRAKSTIFRAVGCLDLTMATLPTELFMNRAFISRGNTPKNHLYKNSDSKGVLSEAQCSVVFRADTATINYLNIERSVFIGSLSMRDITVAHGVNGKAITVRDGFVDLWRSSVGFLNLDNLLFLGVPPPEEDKSSRSDILHLGRGRIVGKLTLRLRKRISRPRVERYYANFRELETGALEDGNVKGWEDLHLKLEGFLCKRAPTREAKSGTTPSSTKGISYLLIELFAAYFGRENPVSRELYKHFHSADAHIQWLNHQYVDPRKPKPEEFVSSAYDRLSEALRDDGHDNEAKRVLSAKFNVKRKVDVPGIAQPLWWAYYFFFDYGLSATNALLTFAGCVAFGFFFFRVATQGFQPLSLRPVMVVTSGPLTMMAIPDKHPTPDSPYTVGALTTTKSDFPEEVPCGKDRIDTFLFAFETFVPALDLTQTSLCEISTEPRAKWWRLLRSSYVFLGWIVTSITLLTIPGILRNRAEG
jgi:hypothetical protein